VVTRVKADLACASVAAASVIAKTTRDAVMEGLADAHPGYGWQENRGYATPAHIEALARLGASGEHRRSWSLPGLDRGGRQAGGGAADAQECPS
jgi:ribonuclease HII